jgi:flagellar protein FliO/FliZ
MKQSKTPRTRRGAFALALVLLLALPVPALAGSHHWRQRYYDVKEAYEAIATPTPTATAKTGTAVAAKASATTTAAAKPTTTATPRPSATPTATAGGENTPLNLDAPAAKKTSANTGGSTLRAFGGLALVLALIYGLHWVLKRTRASSSGGPRGQGLSSHASLPLGQNRSLHLVQSGEDVLLLGVTDHHVTELRTYTGDDALAMVTPDPEETPAPRGTGAVATLQSPASWLDALRARTVRR